MDLDLLEDNVTDNFTFDPNTDYDISHHIYLEIPTAIVALSSSVANVLIIFLAIRYRELHTRLYFYLVNWCICNFVITVSAVDTLSVLGLVNTLPATVLCMWTEANFACMFGNLMFVGTLTVDWYVMTFTSQTTCSINCRRRYKLIAAIIWALVAIILIEGGVYCSEFTEIPFLIFVVCFTYFAVSVLIIIISILRFIKLKTSSVVVEKSTIEFKLVISHLLCWLPNIIFLIFHVIFTLSYTLASICYTIWYSNACIIFLILFLNDNNFKIALSKLCNIKFNVSNEDKKDVPLIVM